MEYRFKAILQSSGWRENVRITVDEAGLIVSIEEVANGNPAGYAIPGFRNCHSHAFQYAMAGLAERHDRSSGRDDFWGWRDTMYRLALSLDPDQVEAIAAMLYSEMVRHGYTHVCEFHYLHHDKDGKPYANLAEMGERLIAAAETAGINITLLPVFYQKGGFGKDPLPEQRRFISPAYDDYCSLLDHCIKACNKSKFASPGAAVHSLRAVSPEDLLRISDRIYAEPDLPFHIHISEQLREVEDCVAHLGARPIEWMIGNVELLSTYNFVHATHATDLELEGMAGAGVSAVLCPSTEGNLGDGIFPLRRFCEFGGTWSIGTDSHVGLSPFEELRLLDYGQRLTTHRREIFTGESESSAENAIRSATRAGWYATGEDSEDYFEVGNPLNACVIRDDHPLIESTPLEATADRIVYASDPSWLKGTIVNGKLAVRDGEHIENSGVPERFASAVRRLVEPY